MADEAEAEYTQPTHHCRACGAKGYTAVDGSVSYLCGGNGESCNLGDLVAGKRRLAPDDPAEVTSAYLERLLKTLTEGPMGEALLKLAAGDSAIVVKQNRHGEGFVVEVVEKAAMEPERPWVDRAREISEGAADAIQAGVDRGTRNGDGTLRAGTWPNAL